MRKLVLYKPLHPFSITQGFGRNDGFDYTKVCNSLGQCLIAHNGLDCIRQGETVRSANVRAAHDGEVIFSGVDSDGGYMVEVRTLEQFTDKQGIPHYWKTVYYHLLRGGIKVRVGQKVRTGDVLALADNSGIYTTADHLHFGLKQIEKVNEWSWKTLNQTNGYFGCLDPLPYLDQKTAYEWKIQFEQIMGSVWNLIAVFQRS